MYLHLYVYYLLLNRWASLNVKLNANIITHKAITNNYMIFF